MSAIGHDRAMPINPILGGNELYDVVNNNDTVVLDDADEKHAIPTHVEDSKEAEKEQELIYIPPTERLGLWQAFNRYKYASVLCFMAGLSGWCDGYEQGMSGSIIALSGFIRQFGYPNSAGVWALNTNDVSLFTCMFLMSMIDCSDEEFGGCCRWIYDELSC
jgi:hypothetical protein